MAQNPHILIEPHETLRKTATEIRKEDIHSSEIQNLIKKMAEVLLSCPNGVGLAAPQIGASLRIFVALKQAATLKENEEIPKKNMDGNPLSDIDVYINPEIKKQSRSKIIMDEGCLSVPNVYGKIKRAEKITVRAFNEKGETFERGASGLVAQIIQHEVDHLNGALFIDTAKNLEKYEPPSEQIS